MLLNFLTITVKDHSPEHLGRLEKLRATYKAKKEAKEAEEAEERNRQYLIVSIDLGCTYTGIAFIATIHQRPQVQVMNEWPNGDRMAKVATRIAYADENGTLQENAYGYKVSPGLKSYSWFKLHFDRNTPETEFDDPRLRQSSGLGIGKLPPGKSVVDINADFLSFVYDQAFKFLSSRMGEIMVQETPMKFFLTTPALWSFEARAKTREAATRAGFGMRRNSARVEDQLYVIDEPEAAAIAAIKTTIDQLPGANPFEVSATISLKHAEYNHFISGRSRYHSC